MKAVTVLAAPVAAVLVLLFGVVVVLGPSPSPAVAAGACTAAPAEVSGVDLDEEQQRVAGAIIDVGRSSRIAPRGWVIALATGLQESGLRPLPYGDRDSIGVFQQRIPWGSYDQRIDPRTSAEMFFHGGRGGQPGLLDIEGWQDMAVTEAAQAVQRSAYPDAYAKWEPLALEIVSKVADVDAGCTADWVLPTGEASYVLTASFGECGDRWASCHTGQDFAVPNGTPILAAGAGVVTFAGHDGPYGNAIHIDHGQATATWYTHLSQLHVGAGARVETGQLIGLSGETGNTTGPHLHFEVRLDGTPTDPMPWLADHHAFDTNN